MKCYQRRRMDSWHETTPCKDPAEHFLIYIELNEPRNLCKSCYYSGDKDNYLEFCSAEERDLAMTEMLL